MTTRTIPTFVVILSDILMYGEPEPNSNHGALGPLAVFTRKEDAENYVKCGRRRGFLPPARKKGVPKVSIVAVELNIPEEAFALGLT